MEAPRFACDAMLGGLARWLRFAGFDTIFDPSEPRDRLFGLARAEDRWMLTCQRAFPVARVGPRLVILSRQGVQEQLHELEQRLGLTIDPKRFFTRCSRCNGFLVEISRDEIRDRVPPFIAVHAQRFLCCAGCCQIYWPGTHQAKISKQLEELFAGGLFDSGEYHGMG